MDAITCFTKRILHGNFFRTFTDFSAHHIVVCLMVVGFCMRWDILYCQNISELLIKRLPLQLLCLLLGVGLAFVIRTNIEDLFPEKEKLIRWGFFFIAYIVLITTGILWTRYTDLTLIAMYSIIIGLLRIIEKNKIGIFATQDKTLIRKIVFLVFTFFIIIDLAYKPMDRTKQSGVQSIVSVAEEKIFEDNTEKLKSFSERRWEKLSIDEKLDVLQIVANIELNHLGLDHELRVYATVLGKNTNACYSPKSKTVNVNIKRLEYAKAYEMLSSVAHESYHAYQHRMVEVYKTAGEQEKKLLVFRKFEKYSKEMNNYKSGKADYEAYYNQTMEVDARAYGQVRSKYYYDKLNIKE